MIVVDTSAVLHLVSDRMSMYAQVSAAVNSSSGPLLLSPFVLAEIDYMIGRDVGPDARLRFLDEVAQGAYELIEATVGDLRRAREVMEQYRDLDVGLADASIVVLAERRGVVDILTLDQRHFRAMRGPDGKPFRILPADLSV